VLYRKLVDARTFGVGLTMLKLLSASEYFYVLRARIREPSRICDEKLREIELHVGRPAFHLSRFAGEVAQRRG